MATPKRELTFLLAEPERRLLRAIAARIPPRWRPNHFTALGVLAATGVGVAYALARYGSAWLWMASALLVVQWVGDSLDGTLARVRGVERPRYGYYLDHMTDAYSTVVIGIGVALSHYVHTGLALGGVVLYLALSINVYLESHVLDRFRLGYGRIGPTEVRILLIALNAALALYRQIPEPALPTLLTVENIAAALLLGGLGSVLIARFARNVYVLARMEPQFGTKK
ncbi:MAG TPA: CDP-alcohol phosphatidyltransferase family protein [Gemmatimonadales bacterium]|nr:CDP-alcohol phosphatidyltransferase family protein [Gemmatimonadales bacterium]